MCNASLIEFLSLRYSHFVGANFSLWTPLSLKQFPTQITEDVTLLVSFLRKVILIFLISSFVIFVLINFVIMGYL